MKRWLLCGSVALAGYFGSSFASLECAVGNDYYSRNRGAAAQQVPWYDKHPELQTAGDYRSVHHDTRMDNAPLTYATRQHTPPIDHPAPLPPPHESFDPVPQLRESFSPAQSDWGPKQTWPETPFGARVQNRLRSGAASCGPLWQVGVDFLYMKRTVTSPVTILVDATTQTIEEFNAQSLDFGHRPGLGVRLSRDIGCGASVNFGYLGLYDQQAIDERGGDLALVLPNLVVAVNPSSYRTQYESQLNSFEVNLRQDVCGRFGLSAGLRYINLDDNLLIGSEIGAILTPRHYDIDVDNNLFGAQFGTDVCLMQWNALKIDAMIRCGFYWNNASQTTGTSLVANPDVIASHDTFAVSGEAGIFATYCLTDRWSLRAGYQVLGLHGVALAPEQLQQSNILTRRADIDASGSVLYGGGTFGAQYVW